MAGNGVIFARGGSNQSQAFQPQPRPEPVLNQATAPFFGVRNAAPSATTSTHQFDAAVGVAPAGFADVRATVATYTDDDGFVRTAAANTERIDYDPTTKALLGLYVEPARTNLAPNSEAITHVGAGAPDWNIDVPGPTLSSTNILDPRGTKAGQTINLGTTSASAGGVYININALTVGATFTFSAWMKSSASGGASFARFTYNNTLGWTGGSGSSKFTITPTWTRFSFQGTIPASGNINLGFDNRDSTGTYDSSCTGNIDVWGPQLEIASSASSYIRTTSSASVTRAADSYSFTLGASQTSIQFTFDDGTTQTVSGLTGGATYTIPTNLNRARILYWDDPAALASSGTAAGDNTATAVGAWLQEGVGSSAGANTTTAVAAPIQAEPGTSAGTDTATGAGAWLQSGVGSSAGSNTASATAAPIQAKVGSATGANTVAGVGAWLQAGVGSSAGANTTAAVGSWLQSGVGDAAGANTTSGYASAVPNVGTSVGANTSTAAGAWLQAGIGSSAGTDTATAVGQWLQSGVGSSAGTNTAAAVSSLAGVTWNPSDKSVDVTLSGGNLTATRSSTSTGVNDVQARANTGRTSGGYFEIVFSTVVGGAHNPGIGLGNLSQSVNDYPGHTANSIGWFANGFFRGPTGVQSTPTFGVGDVIGCELTASTAKFYKNGTLVATESSLPAGTLYPIISVASTTDAGTANFGATAMAYLPTGVVSWDGTRTGAVTNVGSAAGSNTSTAVGAWIKASVGSAVGGNVASAVSTQADFNNDYDQSFAGFPGAETGLGTGDFNNDFNNDYAVFHVGNIVSGVGASVGGNIAAAVSSTAIYVPPVTPPAPTVAPQVWYPAREYTRVQAPRAVRTYRTGTELKRSTPQGMKRQYG
jgi:hypothetical protein